LERGKHEAVIGSEGREAPEDRRRTKEGCSRDKSR